MVEADPVLIAQASGKQDSDDDWGDGGEDDWGDGGEEDDDWVYDLDEIEMIKKKSVDAMQMFTTEIKPFKIFQADTVSKMQKERIE